MEQEEIVINGETAILNLVAKRSENDNGIAFYNIEIKQPLKEVQKAVDEYLNIAISSPYDCTGKWFTSSIIVMQKLDDEYVIEVQYGRDV